MKTLQMFAALTIAAALPMMSQNGPGTGPGPGNGPGCTSGICTPASLLPATAEEIKWLTFMREEEKLARDVYRFLNQRWNLPVFDRIATAESQHFATIGILIERYKVADPAAVDTPGEFKDPALAALYAELTTKGALSLKDAFEVGVTVENADIDNLGKALTESNKYDIKRVLNNLMTASFSHLDAFESYLEIVSLQ